MMKINFNIYKGFLDIIKSQLAYLSVPFNLSKAYNFGFMLGMCLMSQIISGLFLAMLYMSGSDQSFLELFKMMEFTDKGILLRYIHINVVSFFFIYLYLHIGRGLYYSSYLNKSVWMSGVTILLLVMATAFVGYVLPNNQMSYWGASVITSLLSEVPYLGKNLVELIWGSVSVCKFTLVRFFSLHFILPFVILFLVLLHIIFLHEEGSSNPLGLNLKKKMMFFEIQGLVDVTGLIGAFFFLSFILFFNKDMFGDDENFVASNLIETPVHIQPEWYFLFAYAVLRSIPNKLGGVVGLVMSIFVLYFLSLKSSLNFKSFMFKPFLKIFYWVFFVNMLFLSWMGACSVEYPYIHMTQVFVFVYFFFFLVYVLN